MKRKIECDACQSEEDGESTGYYTHTCAKRPMTAAERALVEAALLFVARHSEGRGCNVRLDPLNCGSSERIIDAAKAVRAERGGS
jgi:hypothetical protein